MAKRFFGVYGSARGWIAADIARSHDRVLVLCKDRRSAEDLVNDLNFFVQHKKVLYLPAWDPLPFEPISPQTDITAQRISTLIDLHRHQSYIVVAPVEALVQKVIPQHYLETLCFSLSQGEEVHRHDLIKKLDLCGFSNVSLVENLGDLAVRGGVIDLFPSTSQSPIRLEFLDEMIEKIKLFNPESQRTTSVTNQVEIRPIKEFINLSALCPGDARLAEGIARIKQRGKELEMPAREIARLVSYTRSGSHFPGMELLQALLLDLESPLQSLPDDCLIVMNDEVAIKQSLDKTAELIDEREARMKDGHHLIPQKERLYLTPQELLKSLKARKRYFFDHLTLFAGENEKNVVNVRSEPNTEISVRLKAKAGSGNALEPLKEAVTRWRKEKYDIAFVVGSHARAERLRQLIADLDLHAQIYPPPAGTWLYSHRRAPLAILEGHLSAGVKLPNERIVLVSENEIFKERSYRKQQKQASLKKLLSSLAQLKENDFVVHSDYGIGIYRGLKHIVVDDKGSDFLHIEYSDSTLYVPVQTIGRVQKFTAAEGQVPALDKLSSTRWTKTKQKVRESVVSLAGDLIKLYASRTVSKGWRFEPMGAEDERFADGFPFDETPDQLKAIEDTIADMASDRPMDRLVCGDVGFGKTEVAIRAAFKCIEHARQVAVLVPTTILVEQHRRSFEDRFQGWPVVVGALSRFYKPAENKATMEKLATGEIDIVIGTHKLLGKDMKFKDLGLLIIDEEHRFGVQQKERLKQLRSKIDVLTLTATPIPRTLHMSLLGIRDISVISTPPVDRRVIRTYLSHEDEGVVRDAILRELQRGGQCFFVHNRVQSIEAVSMELKKLVPEARIEFAHGQMSEVELENIMRRFVNHELDILVATTIVESGLDVPNANTIIVDRAHTYGLAQLYQLRGRVGRGNRQAYAYFLIPSLKKLGTEAQQRLKVLQSLDDLGLGFNLALRDMEIRGAGNLLGKEQSGTVLSVGFELYSQILREAVLNLKGEELDVSETIDPEVKLGINAYIPEHYVPDVSERLVLYQRLAAIQEPEEANALSDEISDRFGPPPLEVSDLIEVMRFRGLLRLGGVVKGEVSRGRLMLSFSPDARVEIESVMSLVKKDPERFRFTKNLTLSIGLDREYTDPRDLYEIARGTLQKVLRAPAKPTTPPLQALEWQDELGHKALE